MRMRIVAAALLLIVAAASVWALAELRPDAGAGRPTAGVATRATPALRVTRQVTGLDHPWDVQEIGGGRLLITERDRARLDAWEAGRTTRVAFPEASVWVSGETGLMSLAVDPDFASTGRFYTCQGATTAAGHDVRVVAWHYDAARHAATRVNNVITGLPASTGRHGGCRLLILEDGSMLIGTGDAARGTNPENLRSLGGKTLRLDPRTGAPWPGNPFIHSSSRRMRFVHTFGHRNVQGLGQRRDGTLWSVEQGTYRDDEVNLLRNGGDYGYNPVPGYDESVPMTKKSLRGRQYAARWRSGDPTIATSGGSWVYGAQWGDLEGTFAAAALKAERVVFMRFDARGHLRWTRTPAALRQFGRLRSITQVAGGDLLVTTDNGGGKDAVLRVHPRDQVRPGP
jgi:glucose/arabinose dehydrogenase